MQKSLFSFKETTSWEYEKFKNSPLGQLYNTIPWSDLVSLLPSRKTNKGPAPYFDAQGMLGLMFLKHYTGLSDQKLIESINFNSAHQFFCNMRLGHLELIRDTGIISRVRSYLARHLDLENLQELLVKSWKTTVAHPQFLKMDATCMESNIRYPTDAKLLWECCQWVYGRLFQFRKSVGIRLGKARERYLTQHRKQLVYSKLQRKGYKKTRKRIKALLYLLNKGCWHLTELLANPQVKTLVPSGFYQQLHTIFQVYDQQLFLWENPGQKVSARIVSLDKAYLRPIKRGKERKPTEFGAKLHILQVDGLCVVEHFSWNAFHEGKRLKSSIKMHQKLFGPCHQLSADRAYANNENRKYCTTQGIQTGFVAKGRKPAKSIRKLKAALNKDRATRLEGAFGNQKNNYLLNKVKARNASNEKLWIFFGVFTANAMWVTKKQQKASLKIAA